MINELWNSADLSGTRRLYHVVNKTDYVVGVCLEPPKYNHCYYNVQPETHKVDIPILPSTCITVENNVCSITVNLFQVPEDARSNFV